MADEKEPQQEYQGSAVRVTSVSIPSHEVIDGVVYHTLHVNVESPDNEPAPDPIIINKRYSQFERLHHHLINNGDLDNNNNNADTSSLHLPVKRAKWFTSHTSDEFAASRSSALEAYVNEVLAVEALRESVELRFFFGVSTETEGLRGEGLSTMRAAVVREFGDPTDIIEVVNDYPVPQLRSEKHVLIRVHAATLNPVDWKIAAGWFGLVTSAPFLAGFDFSGVVVETGSKCTRLKVGQAVWGYTDFRRTGSFADFLCVEEELTSEKPNNLSFKEAALIPLVGCTCLYSLRDNAKLKEGHKLLILGGSGGTGTCGIQMAKHMGAEVIVTASQRNHDLVTECGADRIINYREEKWEKELVGEGIDAVYDTVGGFDSWVNSHDVMKNKGQYVTICGDKQAKLTIGKLVKTGCSLTNRKFWQLFGSNGYHMVTAFCHYKAMDVLREMVESGALKPVLDSTYSLEDTVKVFQRQKSGRAQGKMAVLLVEPAQCTPGGDNADANSIVAERFRNLEMEREREAEGDAHH